MEPVMFAPLTEQRVGESRCEHNQPKDNWRLVLGGKTRGHLIENLKRDRDVPEPRWPPLGGGNSIASIQGGSPGQWPHEAHHLVPWQQLAKHNVKQYLKKGAKLFADANYSVNHGNNGKFLPFASDLDEWKGSPAKKQALAEQVMSKLGLQLHQGRHSMSPYGAGKKGYKTRVKELLDAARDTETAHVRACKPCADSKNNGKLPPREQMTRKLDGLSRRLEGEINTAKIFVSRRAYLAWDSGSLKVPS